MPLSRLAGCALIASLSVGAAPPADLAIFDYDTGAPLDVERMATERRGAAEIHDVRFAATPGAKGTERTAAYVVMPFQQAPRAAILWGHWLGEPATTNRSQFLDEAVALAASGVASVLVDAMWSKPRWYEERVLEEDFEHGVRQVIAFRRALDLLSQAGVPVERTAFVGHDYSAMYGSVAMAVDGRVRRLVLIAPTASLHDWAFFRAKPSSMEEYLKENRPLELAEHLRRLPSGSRVLLQFAGRDRYVPAAKAEEFAAAITIGNKTVRTYPEAEHDMARPAAIAADRQAWLLDALELR